MSNENTKKKVQVWMDPDLVAQLDGIAEREGTSRAAVLTAAAELYVSGGDRQGGDARIETIIAKLDTLAANQAAIKADQVAHTTLLADAIKSQPIAVQQQVLPAPEVTDDDVQKYIRARRPDIALNMWGDPIEPKKKGLIERMFGK